MLAPLEELMLLSRLVEERMILALRQGHLSKWFSGIGQEAISVGASGAMAPGELILPLHRNLGVFLTREVPLVKLFAQLLGRAEGFTAGRDRSFHFGSLEHGIVGMISHLGAQLGVADGVALAHRLAGERKATLVFTGEGATSEGDFHEALNLAAVWDLPVIFLIENNGYALSTPTGQQYRCAQLCERAAGYGLEGLTIDGNDLEQVYTTVDRLASEIREHPRPVLLECLTFRMRGHEEASGIDYVPSELLEQWSRRDPLAGLGNHPRRDELAARVDEAFEEALRLPPPQPGREEGAVFATGAPTPLAPSGPPRELRFVDALSEALATAFDHDDRVVLMGQDVAEYGGVFKVSKGLVERFGADRVRNTPLCESAVVGAALGLALQGFKPIVEMQFADFVSCAFNQIANNLAPLHYRWGGRAGVVVRMPTGAGMGAGPFHSQSLEGLFAALPGLKVVYPAFPDEAKGMLLAALEEPNPVLYFEHKALYRTLKGPVPEGYYRSDLSKARLVRDGAGPLVVTYGVGVHKALELAERRPDLDPAVLDLRVLAPLDAGAVLEEVASRGKVLLLEEGRGIAGRLAALIAGQAFEYLDAPVVTVGPLETPIPFAKVLEAVYLPWSRLETGLEELVVY